MRDRRWARSGRWWMLGVTCLSVVVVSLDLTILNIALPSISAALHAGTGDLQWIVDAYSLTFAGMMLPAGTIGDRLGRKRLLLTGLAVFLAASAWCALSVSAGELIAARAVMGLGGAIVFPLSLAVVPSAFGDADRPKAIAVLTAVVAAGLPLGPILGGLLLQHFSWHSVFWINVPGVCLTLVAGIVLMPESRNPATPPLDILGALLSVTAPACLVWGAINGPQYGWAAPASWGLLAGSAVLLAAFARHERRTAHPLVDPTVFTDPRFAWGTVATAAISVPLFEVMFTLPQYLESVAGDDPVRAGLRLVPMMGGLVVAGGAASPVARAAGAKITVAAGLALLTAGLVVLSQIRETTGYGVVAAGLTLCGLGIGAAIAAAMDQVMAAVGGDEAGAGASLNSALRQVTGGVAIAVGGSVLSGGYSGSLRPAGARLPAAEAALARSSVTEAAALARHLPHGRVFLRAVGTAYLHSMGDVMIACAVVTALAALTSLRYLPGRASTDIGATSAPRDPATADTDSHARR
ncbi:MAG TPA: MFS transporter [Trebonia sp.]|jgi:EmrB/QacA subfamily drug resistance transporter|nr:MFS transporter [Trebonia sp.]